MVKVETIVNGYLEENCYIVHDGKNGVIIDPGTELDKIMLIINKYNLNIVGLLITHYHFDHTGCVESIKNIFPSIKVYDYKNVGDNLCEPYKFKVIECFGHTMDSCSFYFESEKLLFTGDFLFKETIGNFDSENEEHMFNSLKVLKYMNESILIYPGHGESSSVKYELTHNPFLKGL